MVKETKPDGDLVPLRRSEPAPSQVMPVVRKASGAELVSPIESRVRIVTEISEAALAAYTAAREARARGEGERAKLLCQRAAKALALALEVAEEIATL